ncbi:MAG: hypothetical protein O3B82_00055 [Bacteroidetes bacterium]|nr:hypothetical protein [Bacteroidota bacterium]
MEKLINTILSNPVYMIMAGLAFVIILFLCIKKLFKFVAYASILFIVFLAYVYFTGGSVKESIKDVKEKGEKIMKESKIE